VLDLITDAAFAASVFRFIDIEFYFWYTDIRQKERGIAMTFTKRLLALLLCFAMLLTLAACTDAPAQPTDAPIAAATEAPSEAPTEAPTEPPADLLYDNAIQKLAAESDVALECLYTVSTTVADQLFTEQHQQTIVYNGMGSDDLTVSLSDTLEFNLQEETDTQVEKTPIVYSEIFSGGILYTSLNADNKNYRFSASVSNEHIEGRYLPPALLDLTLYGSISAEDEGSATRILFSEPTAPESWALPADARMLDASGTAVVDAEGNLQQMTYTVTYEYGPSEVTLEVESNLLQSTQTVSVPDNAVSYISIQYPDALLSYISTIGLLGQADAATTSHTESVTSQAAGVVRNQTTSMNLYHVDDLMTKIDTNVYLMDYTTNEDMELKQEELYRNGKYVLTVDDGVPTSQNGIDPQLIEDYCATILLSHMCSPEFWKDVTATDLGSTYLLEFTYTEDFGNTIQNTICSMFWEDPAFLNKLASAYATNETTGYLAVDTFTGLPTAAGYYYKGTHTIEGGDYELCLQSDQSIEVPGMNAYYEITEELLPEAEPEQKATPLFYHVTGDKGQEMWLFGTIHIGDERTAYLPQEIYDAFAASDALALEFYSETFEEKAENDKKFQEQLSKLYFYSNGSATKDHLDEELYENALRYLKASGGYSMNAPYMKPSLWSQTIENFYLRQTYGLSSEKGCESRLEKMAKEQNKEIRDVESGLAQVKMSTGWSDELQELMLEDAISYSPTEYQDSTWELYELWCAGDEAALREAIAEEVDTSELTDEELAEYEAQKPLMEEYNKGMSYDRNKEMLKVAKKYLESDDVVFFAVGLAHLLDSENGLVDTLRDAGYTVELVSYS